MDIEDFDKLIEEAGKVAIERMIKVDLENLNSTPNFQLSKNFDKKMIKMIKKTSRF